MAEWSNAAVLKTVEQRCSGGSNPSLSAKGQNQLLGFDTIEALCFSANRTNLFVGGLQKNKNRLQWSQQLILSVCKDARGSEGMDKRSAVNPADTLANLFCGERGMASVAVILHAAAFATNNQVPLCQRGDLGGM